MSDSEPKITYYPKTSAFLAALPPFLKNPANFIPIQRKILETIQTTCAHGDVLEMAKCKKCTRKMMERRAFLKYLGFKNAGQYMAWRKIHEEIQRRFPLMDWKTRMQIHKHK